MNEVFNSSIVVYDDYGKKIDGVWSIPDNTIQSVKKFTKSNGNFLSQNKTIYISWVVVEDSSKETKNIIKVILNTPENINNFDFNFNMYGYSDKLKDVSYIVAKQIGNSNSISFSWDSSLLEDNVEYLVFKDNQYLKNYSVSVFNDKLKEKNKSYDYKILAKDKNGIMTRNIDSSNITVSIDGDDESNQLSISNYIEDFQTLSVTSNNTKSAKVPLPLYFRKVRENEEQTGIILTWIVPDSLIINNFRDPRWRQSKASFKIHVVPRDDKNNIKNITVDKTKGDGSIFNYALTGLNANKFYDIYVRTILDDGSQSNQVGPVVKKAKPNVIPRVKVPSYGPGNIFKLPTTFKLPNTSSGIQPPRNLNYTPNDTIGKWEGKEVKNGFTLSWDPPLNLDNVQKYAIYKGKKLVQYVNKKENKANIVLTPPYSFGHYSVVSVGKNNALSKTSNVVSIRIKDPEVAAMIERAKAIQEGKKPFMPPSSVSVGKFIDNDRDHAVLTWEHYDENGKNVIGDGYEYFVYRKIDGKIVELGKTQIGLYHVFFDDVKKKYMFCVKAKDMLTGEISNQSTWYSVIPKDWTKTDNFFEINDYPLSWRNDLNTYKDRTFSTRTDSFSAQVYKVNQIVKPNQSQSPYSNDNILRLTFKNSPIYFDFWFEKHYDPKYKEYAYLFDSKNQKIRYEGHFFDASDFMLKSEYPGSYNPDFSELSPCGGNWNSGFRKHTKLHKTLLGTSGNYFQILVLYYDENKNKYEDMYYFYPEIFKKFQSVLKYK